MNTSNTIRTHANNEYRQGKGKRWGQAITELVQVQLKHTEKHESSKTTYYNGYGGLIDNEFLKTLHEIWNKEQTFHPAQAYEQTQRIVLDLI